MVLISLYVYQDKDSGWFRKIQVCEDGVITQISTWLGKREKRVISFYPKNYMRYHNMLYVIWKVIFFSFFWY